MRFRLDLTAAPDPEDLAQIGLGLSDFNDNSVGPAQKNPLAIFVRDRDNAIAGGLSGYTGWGWLYVQWLFLAPVARRQAITPTLLAMAEAQAIDRHCHGAYIDTFNPEALMIYKRADYKIFGQLPDFPKGHTRYFLQKTLI